MLKISVVENPTCRVLVLEGKLVGPWAEELRTAYENARTGLQGRELIIDLKHITGISQAGESVLLQLINEGVKFRCREVFMKRVLKQLARCVNKKP